MRRVSALVVLLCVVAVPAGAAKPYFQKTGTVALPNPATKVTGGISERLAPCGATDRTLGNQNGVDAFWFALPAGSGNRKASMTSAAMDMDVWFYDSTCDVIVRSEDERALNWATNNTPGEQGVVPLAAAYVAVAMAAGKDATFTFTVTEPSSTF